MTLLMSLDGSESGRSQRARRVGPALCAVSLRHSSGSCNSETLLFTRTLSSSITTSLGTYPCWSGSRTACVIPFEGYIYHLASTDRISVRHSEWSSSSQRPRCFSMHTHTHILLFYSYHMYLKSERERERERDRVSEADSAFTEERWMD
jgi:hypothetical protein